MNIFQQKLREKDEPPKPFSHPPIPEGYERIKVDGIEASTEKAILITVNDTRKVWVPKSVSHYRYGNSSRGETEMDRTDVIDIESDFYEQSIM